MITLESYLETDWMDLAETDPVAFVREVENRCIIDSEYQQYINFVKKGAKVTRETASKRVNRKLGDWSIHPYFSHGVQMIKRGVKRGRLPLKEAFR